MPILFIPFLVVIIVVIVILLIVNIPQICFAGVCWTPIHQAFASKINFYFAVFIWFAFQFIIFYLLYHLGRFIAKLPSKYDHLFNKFSDKILKLMKK